jgi:hypothetical protein
MERVKVVGVKWFKGNIDGKDFDNGTAYIEEKLDDRRGTAKGYASTAYKLGSSAVAQALAKRDFPLQCMAEFERLSDGKGSSEPVIVDIRPAQDEAPAESQLI